MIEKENVDAFWESLSEENKLKAFCAVISKLSKAELEQNLSYRDILYDAFNFGPESYALGMSYGFFTLHSSIYSNSKLENIFRTILRNSQLDESSVNWEKFWRYYYGLQ